MASLYLFYNGLLFYLILVRKDSMFWLHFPQPPQTWILFSTSVGLPTVASVVLSRIQSSTSAWPLWCKWRVSQIHLPWHSVPLDNCVSQHLQLDTHIRRIVSNAWDLRAFTRRDYGRMWHRIHISFQGVCTWSLVLVCYCSVQLPSSHECDENCLPHHLPICPSSQTLRKLEVPGSG